MAEATGLRNNALEYPIYGLPWGLAFPILDADGDLVTGAAALDSEVSKNGDTFADCTNEATEIATSSGVYYLLATATEMSADVVAFIVKTSTSGAKTTTIILTPRKLPTLRSGTAQAGAAGTLTLDSSAVAVDDYYNGCVVYLDGGTGSGQVRVITDYAGSTKVATVAVNWATTPDNTSTFVIKLPEGQQVHAADVMAVNNGATAAANLKTAADAYSATRGLAGTALPAAAADAAGGLPISDAGGLDLDAKLANTNEITAARMGALTDWINGGRLDLLLDAILEDTGTTLDGRIPAALVGGRMDASAGAMAANVLTASALATDAVTEITDAILALVIETGLTFKNAMRLCAAAAAAKISGAGTTTITIRNAVADDKDRITATVDADGNRSAIVLDLT